VEAIVPAWSGSNDYLDLRTLLDVIGTNDWVWRLDDFHGTTRAEAGVNAVDLENRLRGGESFTFTWAGVLDFADKVDQLIDGRLTAIVPGEVGPALTVEAHDSTDWKVTAMDRNARAVAAVNRVAALAH
jgi:hypothetical protein